MRASRESARSSGAPACASVESARQDLARPCASCGSLFEPRRRHAVCCSPSCRARWSREREEREWREKPQSERDEDLAVAARISERHRGELVRDAFGEATAAEMLRSAAAVRTVERLEVELGGELLPGDDLVAVVGRLAVAATEGQDLRLRVRARLRDLIGALEAGDGTRALTLARALRGSL